MRSRWRPGSSRPWMNQRSPSLVDARALTEGRVFVTIQGEGALANDADRLNEQVGKFRLLGLPVRVVDRRRATLRVGRTFHQGGPDRRQDRRDARPDHGQLQFGCRSVGTTGQVKIPGPRLGGCARRQGHVPDHRSRDRRGVRDGQAGQADRGKHNAQGRQPPAVHTGERDSQGRALGRLSDPFSSTVWGSARPVRHCWPSRPPRPQSSASN